MGDSAWASDARAGPEREREGGEGLDAAEALLGAAFTTRKELRHLAEQALGRLFVPTDVEAWSERSADLVLRPGGMDEIHVHGRRERAGSPFVVTSVDGVMR